MKIAFIAMSGIRACDEELLRMGLTLPGFVERSKTIASLPSLGLLTLAGMTPARHAVEYIEVPDLTELGELPTGFDLVAISSFSAQIDEAYLLAERFRAEGVPVVIGGLHVTSLPEEALAHCDAVVVGEGEAVWPRVLEDAERGCLGGIYDACGQEFDLTQAPMPAFDLLDISKYNRLTIQTSRGCPHKCQFCASSILLTQKYKQKPIAKVLAELDKILELWPRPFIEFADDNSLVNRAYWHELLPELERRKIRWFTETDLSIYEDEVLLKKMRRSGCAQVLIGFESPNETGMGGLELRSDWKRRRVARYKDAIRTIQSHGITVNGCFILGLDGQTPAVFDEVYDFVVETELYEVQATLMTPFPGTPLYGKLEREGRLLYPGQWQRCTLFDVNFEPSHMSANELADGFKGLVSRLYSDEFTHWRREHFRHQLRGQVAV